VNAASSGDGDPATLECAITTETIAAAGDAVLALGPPGGAEVHSAPWDHRSRPLRLDLVERRFSLTPEERERLMKEGFVVPERLRPGYWSDALHEVYQSELPLWVSADAVLYAISASNDRLMARLEEGVLAGKLEKTLAAMQCALPAAATAWPKETAEDVDLYLTVARSLLADAPVASAGGAVDARAAELVKAAKGAEGLEEIDLFGRTRRVDFSQYEPRGHYKATPRLEAFFRAAMWLSRVELNLVSRSCRSSALVLDPRETPREDVDAMALAELVEAAHVADDVALLDRAWTVLAGKREDVTLLEIQAMREKAGIATLTNPEAAAALRAAIGNTHPRTARIHPMPEGSTNLPAIATLLGPRITPDTSATRPLVHTEIERRHLVTPADFAYVLGHDRALAHMTQELKTYPTLGAQLVKARALVDAKDEGHDLYGAWLDAIRELARPPAGEIPSFMKGTAFADRRIESSLAAYAALRHNNVLVVGQGYDEGGCEIPDAWVDPVPALYDALVEYAQRGKGLVSLLDPVGAAKVGAYFDRLARTLRILSTIARWELTGKPLPKAMQRWLSLVVELRPYGGTGGPPSFTGWWFDLFRLRQEGLEPASIVVDTFTSFDEEKILYLGALEPRMGIFVVDVGGPPRVVVGPVSRAFSYIGPLGKRLSDDDVARLPGAAGPWAASYTVAPREVPPLEVRGAYPVENGSDLPATISFEIRSNRPVGNVTLQAIDHHRVAYASVTRAVGTAWTKITFKYQARTDGAIDGLRVRAAGTQVDLPRPHQPWTEEKPTTIDEVVGGMPRPKVAPPP
jgi:uncharacterized protein DUF3160